MAQVRLTSSGLSAVGLDPSEARPHAPSGWARASPQFQGTRPFSTAGTHTHEFPPPPSVAMTDVRPHAPRWPGARHGRAACQALLPALSLPVPTRSSRWTDVIVLTLQVR